jgi:phosphoribosylaminoimidazole-succinocarboxamide synthase
MNEPLLQSDIPGLKLASRGKVRDIYELGSTLLIVTTDRISAFDVIMPNGIPDKGRVLTALSRFWFLHLRPFLGNHYITADWSFIANQLAEKGVRVTPDLSAQLRGRSMLVLKATVFPVECVVRGYLAGSLWKEYVEADGPASGATLHGIALPAGLRESDKLPEPIFTPATKATSGHDENISFAEMERTVGGGDATAMRRASLNIYRLASERCAKHGLILADTKFEFGIQNGALTLVDEALTPDSSRYWAADAYQPGRPQDSFDKQYLRDWLSQSGWNKEPPAPPLPADVVRNTSAKYREAYRRVTGEELPPA